MQLEHAMPAAMPYKLNSHTFKFLNSECNAEMNTSDIGGEEKPFPGGFGGTRPRGLGELARASHNHKLQIRTLEQGLLNYFAYLLNCRFA